MATTAATTTTTTSTTTGTVAMLSVHCYLFLATKRTVHSHAVPLIYMMKLMVMVTMIRLYRPHEMTETCSSSKRKIRALGLDRVLLTSYQV